VLQDCLKQPSFACPLLLEAKLVGLSLASSFLCNKLKSARNFLVTAEGQNLRFRFMKG
jgi:hypothetical protein